MKKDDESKYSLYIEYIDENNLCGGSMLGNYPMMGLNGTKYSNLLTNLSKIIKIVSLGIFKLTRNIQNNYDLHVMIWFFILKKQLVNVITFSEFLLYMYKTYDKNISHGSKLQKKCQGVITEYFY